MSDLKKLLTISNKHQNVNWVSMMNTKFKRILMEYYIINVFTFPFNPFKAPLLNKSTLKNNNNMLYLINKIVATYYKQYY